MTTSSGSTPASADTLPPITDEAERRRDLRKHKAIATGLLVVATFIYLYCEWLGTDYAPWVGYVRAASEAGMVGALADWFAVTALFRRPLNLPIPHTAIIRRKKDQVGEALSEFVGDNFLNAQLITEKISTADVPRRVGAWAAEPEHAERVSHEIGKAAVAIVQSIDDNEAADALRRLVIDRLAEPDWGPPAGRTIEQFVAEGKAEPLVDGIVEWGYHKAVDSHETIDRLLSQRAPSWAPAFVNELLGDRVYREIVDFMDAVRKDPDHEARQALRRTISRWADELQHDPGMIQRVEEFKQDVLDSAPMQAAPLKLWRTAADTLITVAADPQSPLRRRIVQEVLAYGHRLTADEPLRQRWNQRVTNIAGYVAENYAGEVTAIISETIERWDADEASEKIELMVGKDLQFIRLNGTIVGALAGLFIYTVSQLAFG